MFKVGDKVKISLNSSTRAKGRTGVIISTPTKDDSIVRHYAVHVENDVFYIAEENLSLVTDNNLQTNHTNELLMWLDSRLQSN